MTIPETITESSTPSVGRTEWMQSLEDWLSDHVTGIGILFISLFLGTSIIRDLQRPIWYDEIFARDISRLDPALMWRALSQGVDNQPYPFYLLTHYSLRFLGDNSFALRFPQTLGFGCMGVCLYFLLRRRVRAIVALATAMLPLAGQTVSYYASEGRPYGLELGFCGLLLVCWQAAAEGRNRRWALAGLGASVAGLVSSHYLAALILVPIGLAELVRAFQNRRPDVPVACVILAGLAPLLAFIPHIAAMRIYKDGYWAKPSIDGLKQCLRLSEPIAWIGAGFLCVPPFFGLRPRNWGSDQALTLPLHERVAIAALFALPLIAMAAAIFTGAFFARYVLAAAMGASVLCGVSLDRLARRTPALRLVFLLLMVGVLASRTVASLTLLGIERPARLSTLLQTAARSPLPVVMNDSIDFLEQYEKGDSTLNTHLWYIADPERAKRFRVGNTGDLGLIGLRSYVNVKVLGPGDFLSAHPSFELVLFTPRESWLLPYLKEKGARIELEGVEHDLQMFHVDVVR